MSRASPRNPWRAARHQDQRRRGARSSQRFEQVNEHNRRSQEKLLRVRAAASPVVQLAACAGSGSLVLAFALGRVVQLGVPVNEFVGYITAMMLLMSPLKRLVNVGGPLAAGIAAGQGIFAVLDEARESTGGERPLARARREWNTATCRSAMATAQAWCCSPSASRCSRARRWPSWAGPARASPRWWACCRACMNTARGRSCWMAWRCASTHAPTLRRQIAYVGQEPLLLDDTIRNNIALGHGGRGGSRRPRRRARRACAGVRAGPAAGPRFTGG